MWELKYKDRNSGFTLIELLVTISIIGVLAGIATIAVGKIRSTKNQTLCVNNLRAISQGLQQYYNDYMSFPDDGYPDDGYLGENKKDKYPLSADLANYINDKSTFVCPEDNDTTSINNFASYDPYYVARKGSYGSDELAIGCPRHRGGKSSTGTFTNGSTKITSVGAVDINGQEIPPDGNTAQRTISNKEDNMTFADGSTVKITDDSGGSYGCFLVQSVRLSDGTLYSIVKVQDSGTIDVNVTSGSKFEVVAPSAIVGVRGTHFTVVTSDNGSRAGYQTDVELFSGNVCVLDRETGETTILTTSTGQSVTTTGDTPMHSHYHTHANGEKHIHEHPSINNAHHGKPIAGTGDEESYD
ncbi:type II secretory system protein [Candidatus Scalindua japonica]|uniref:Type II secretory system protein n=1 Tax=Candidatus Scalindua japonica TaxID=1284222 RepID=A0A286TY99_9BACT|nr:prepilin-type N-terminal cleavage/methylation domain-containing protein [Candidatus Scalindua japonica]GAX60873.1 type II secretory system protein [Candidatus Scalindua japonica]